MREAAGVGQKIPRKKTFFFSPPLCRLEMVHDRKIKGFCFVQSGICLLVIQAGGIAELPVGCHKGGKDFFCIQLWGLHLAPRLTVAQDSLMRSNPSPSHCSFSAPWSSPPFPTSLLSPQWPLQEGQYPDKFLPQHCKNLGVLYT